MEALEHQDHVDGVEHVLEFLNLAHFGEGGDYVQPLAIHELVHHCHGIRKTLFVQNAEPLSEFLDPVKPLLAGLPAIVAIGLDSPYCSRYAVRA